MSLQLKRQLSVFVSLVILLALSACAGETEDPGYTHVIGADAIVRFEAVPSLLQIQDVAVAASGEVWALQRTRAPHLFWFSDDGRLLDSRGMSGSGRGQLSNPFNLLPTDDARTPMRVWDAGNRRVASFRQNGAGLGANPVDRSEGQVYREIERDTYGRPLQMENFGDGFLLTDHPYDLSTTADYLRSRVLVLGNQGALINTLMNFDQNFEDSAEALGRRVEYLVPIPLWTTCQGDAMVLLDPFSRKLHWYGVDGNAMGTDSLPLAPREITEDDLTTFLSHRFGLRWQAQRPNDPIDSTVIDSSVVRELAINPDKYQTKAPPAVGMMCRADREVWLQEFSTSDHPLGYGNRWLVHTPGSIERVYVQFPADFRPLKLLDDRALGVHTDTSGIQTVAYVPVPAEIAPPPGEQEH